MNFQNLLRELERQLDEVVDNPLNWPESDLKQYLNDAQMDIIIDSFDNERIPIMEISTQTISSTISSATYTFGTNPLIPIRLLYDNAEIFPCTIEDLERDDEDWRDEDNGTPSRFVWLKDTIIFLNPPPDTASKTIQMDFINYPTTLTATNDTPQIPALLHRAIVYKAAIEALGAREIDFSYFSARYGNELIRYRKLQGKMPRRERRLIPVTNLRDRAFSGIKTKR